MVSRLVRSSPDRTVLAQALAEGAFCCVLTVCLSTQVYKWLPATLMLGEGEGVTLRWTSIPSRGVWGRSRNTPGRFTKTRKISGLMCNLARIQTLPYLSQNCVFPEKACAHQECKNKRTVFTPPSPFNLVTYIFY